MIAAKKPSAHKAPAKKQLAVRRAAGKPAVQSSVRVLRQFRLVFNAVKTHFREVEKKSGVAGAQLWALSVIAERPGVGTTELARAMDVHQSTASNLVRSLLEQELVATRKSGADRRTVQLHVLAAGSRALRRAPGPFAGMLPSALSSLDSATLVRLERDLNKLITVLGGDERRPDSIP
ncbi:MAG: transcriptional regulator, MarR family [Ramlibacter sp.]|nr:transcriptional regulator, MarR family [Ramlibacter sp.]